MFESSHRTLPPLAPFAEFLGGSQGRLNHHHYQPHHIRSPPEEEPTQENMERSGECLVILPFSRSAFRGSQHAGPNKCECSSFFMSPGDPNSCLCGHPAGCHSTKSPEPESPSNESSPYIAPVSTFQQGYAGPMPSPPASVQHPSPPPNSHHHQDNALTPVILARLTQLEKLLTSEIHARQLLQENQKYIQLTQQRLSQHCRCLSEEIDLIIAKSGESARESLDLEVLNQRQKKMTEDIERMKGALEGLDERTEDLEFRNDDLEKWVEEEKEERKMVVQRGDGMARPVRDGQEARTMMLIQKLDGASYKRTTINPTITAPLLGTSSALPSPPPSSKRRRSPSDADPPSYELSCIIPSISNMITTTGTNSPAVANKRLRYTA